MGVGGVMRRSFNIWPLVYTARKKSEVGLGERGCFVENDSGWPKKKNPQKNPQKEQPKDFEISTCSISY